METTDPNVSYAGWVYKEGSLVKNWKKRFLVVKRHELAYYKTTGRGLAHAQLMGDMRIERAERAPGITNGLIIWGMDGRQLKIFMDAAPECERCYDAIAKWCNQSGGVYPQSVASSSSMGATQQGNPTHHSGWLDKQSFPIPVWKRRFFVLDGFFLMISVQADAPPIERYRVLGTRRDRTRPFTLEITVDNARELRVSAESEMEIDGWHRKLREALQMPTGGMLSPAAHQQQQQRPHQHHPYEEESPLFPQAKAQKSWRGLFGLDEPTPANQHQQHPHRQTAQEDADDDDSPRHATESKQFGRNIQLDLRGENPSFIEFEDDANEPPAKPYSPRAPGRDTILQMRIDQNIIKEEDLVTTTSSQSEAGSTTVHMHAPPATAHEATAPCCCVVM